MSQGEKNVQSDRGSNPRPLAYRASTYQLSYLAALRIISPLVTMSEP